MDIKHMRIIFALLVVIGLFVLNSSSQNSRANDPVVETQIDNIINVLTKLDNSSNIILSIDCSGSLNDTNKRSKKTALSFINKLRNSKHHNIKMGYVLWSSIPLASSTELSSNLTRIYGELNNIANFGGNTCIKAGLNESINLIRKEAIPGENNVIILISDGLENCTVGSSLTCEGFEQMNSTGIYIYTIQIGKSNEGSSLLKCLEKKFEVIVHASDKSENQLNTTYAIPTQMDFDVESNKFEKKDINTNITISKEISGGAFGPKITIGLRAPGVEAIKTDVVIAIDSSGSFGKGGRAEYGNNIRKSIPVILEDIAYKMPISNISVLSWDDNIDYAYSPLTNSLALNANLVPISIALMDKNYLISENNYICRETEYSNLSIGLDSAREILNGTHQKPTYGIRKLIILITGRSEFTPCNETSIAKAKNENCDIHTVGIGVIDGSDLHKQLIEIAGNRTTLDGDRKKYHYSAGSEPFNNNVVATVVRKALEQFFKENILNEIVIEDTLYPYFKFDNNTLRVSLNGAPLNKDQVNISNQLNSDGTTTSRFLFNRSLNMKPNDYIEVSFETIFSMALPLDLLSKNHVQRFQIDQSTQISSISYKWLGNNHAYDNTLPECNIIIK